MEIISVIIPVFNSEKYIHKCLESVLRQTYNNLQIIVVDDGSGDDSPHICDVFEEKDTRIKVIHKVNEGVSKARNIALDFAIGKYVVFIDSDDYIEVDFIEKMYLEIKYNNVDLGLFSIIYEDEYGNVIEQSYKSFNSMEISREQALVNILTNKSISGYLVNKIFKKDLIDIYNMRFNSDIHICEDLLFCTQYVMKSNKFSISDYAGYHYVKNYSSCMACRGLKESISACIASIKVREAISTYDNILDVQLVQLSETLSIISSKKNELLVNEDINKYNVIYNEYIYKILKSKKVNLIIKLKLVIIGCLGVCKFLRIKRYIKSIMFSNKLV